MTTVVPPAEKSHKLWGGRFAGGPSAEFDALNNSIGVEFTGNYPNVRKPATEAQIEAWRILVRVLQARYGVPTDRIFAHNWIDYKDRRYCEGCALAAIARAQGAQIALQGPSN